MELEVETFAEQRLERKPESVVADGGILGPGGDLVSLAVDPIRAAGYLCVH
jgi:hypothetical protein